MRRTQADLGAVAEGDIADAFRHLGLQVQETGGDGGADLVLDVDGRRVPVAVKAVGILTPSRVVLLPDPPGAGVAPVVVADSVAAAAEDALRDRKWGWLDRRRGHLVVRSDGLFVDTFVPIPDSPVRPDRESITGRAGMAFAAALLMSPQDPPSIRSVASLAGMGSSTVGEAAVKLRHASLVKEDGSPLVPELFWELAAAWPSDEATALRRLPDDGVLDDVDAALTGTAGALAYGAPVVVAGDVAPDFLVPDAATVARLRRTCGTAENFDERACTVTAAPTRLACTTRVSLSGETRWSVAHPVFVALDLAQDRGRGQEILEGFTPPDGFTRVW